MKQTLRRKVSPEHILVPKNLVFLGYFWLCLG